ncbi:hypothetical protein L0F63_002168 [Massospora cicadina]|nr:hypothetical protein L0F63_002168 [Massospora cicadina]
MTPADANPESKEPAFRYFDPQPLPSQWDVPLPGGGGAVLEEKELWKQAYFYLRVSLVVFVFIFQSMATCQLQLFVTPVYLVSQEKYLAILRYSQELFGVAMVSLHQLFAPTTFVLYKDASIPGPLFTKPSIVSSPSCKVALDDLKFQLDFPDRIDTISNHQLYSDWIYIGA